MADNQSQAHGMGGTPRVPTAHGMGGTPTAYGMGGTPRVPRPDRISEISDDVLRLAARDAGVNYDVQGDVRSGIAHRRPSSTRPGMRQVALHAMHAAVAVPPNRDLSSLAPPPRTQPKHDRPLEGGHVDLADWTPPSRIRGESREVRQARILAEEYQTRYRVVSGVTISDEEVNLAAHDNHVKALIYARIDWLGGSLRFEDPQLLPQGRDDTRFIGDVGGRDRSRAIKKALIEQLAFKYAQWARDYALHSKGDPRVHFYYLTRTAPRIEKAFPLLEIAKPLKTRLMQLARERTTESERQMLDESREAALKAFDPGARSYRYEVMPGGFSEVTAKGVPLFPITHEHRNQQVDDASRAMLTPDLYEHWKATQMEKLLLQDRARLLALQARASASAAPAASASAGPPATSSGSGSGTPPPPPKPPGLYLSFA